MNDAHWAGHTLRKTMHRFTNTQAGSRHEIETDIAEIQKGIILAEALFPAWVIVLCQMHHPGFPYISKNSEAIMGYPPAYLMNLTPEAYFALVHPEDLPAIRHMAEYMNNFMLAIENFNPLQYRFVFQYRLRQPGGGYTYLQDEKVVIENEHRRHVFFTLYKEASKEQAVAGAKLEIYQIQGCAQVKIEEHVPRHPDMRITQREKEIVQLIRDGLSSLQISEMLAISVHTVKNHRRNLFQKAKVRNSRELLLYAQQAKWI
jgi:DNA-binding CsgD family transcriptional regulator